MKTEEQVILLLCTSRHTILLWQTGF